MSTSERDKRLASLFARTHAGIKPGLDLTRNLLEKLGNPQEKFLTVHVAGTNGKGSTCAMIEAGLREAGLRTGLFTSPHLVRVNERIRIAGTDVSDEAFYEALDRIDALEGALERSPTFFETLTALAFLLFAEQGVQVAVLETGMGGRWDCTNVVTPLVSVITRVDMDHQHFLGDTLELIAEEKAGIIKPGRPVVVGAQSPGAEEVLRRRAEDLGSPLIRAMEQVSVSGRRQEPDGQRMVLSTGSMDVGSVRIPLPGPYQVENACTAVAAVEVVGRLLSLPEDAEGLKRALAGVRWRGRAELLSAEPPILLDVAHNTGGAKALAEALRERFGRKAKGVFVLASMADKDHPGLLRMLAPLMSEAWCVELDNPRALAPQALAEKVRARGVSVTVMDLDEAKRSLERRAAESDFGCVTGSVYLAGAWIARAATDLGERMR